MRRIAAIVLACLLAPSSLVRGDEPVSRDWLGDPLPPGAIARLGTVRNEAELPDGYAMPESVRGLAVSPDGRLAATYGERSSPPFDHPIRLWNAATGEAVRVLDGHAESIRMLAFSPDGRLLVSSTAGLHGGETSVWDVRTGERPLRIEGGGAAVHFPWVGGTLAVAVDEQVHHHSLATGEEVQRFIDLRYGLAFSADGHRLLCGSHRGDPQLRLHRVTNGVELLKLTHLNVEPRAAALAPDGRTVAADDGQGRVALWEVATGDRVRTIEADARRVYALVFSADGRLFASGGSDGRVRLWDVFDSDPVGQWLGHQGPVTCLTFGADGRTLFSGSTDRTVLAWDVERVLSQVAPREPGEADLATLWDRLAAPSGADAHAAIRDVISASERSLPHLRQQLHDSLFPVSNERIPALIRELGHADFRVRRKATRELMAIRLQAQPILLKAAENASVEVRARIRRILFGLEDAPRYTASDVRRLLRVMQILELTSDPSAEETLEMLIREFPSDQVVQEARETLARIRHRRQR